MDISKEAFPEPSVELGQLLQLWFPALVSTSIGVLGGKPVKFILMAWLLNISPIS